jgi:hypothetical protein
MLFGTLELPQNFNSDPSFKGVLPRQLILSYIFQENSTQRRTKNLRNGQTDDFFGA